MIRITAISTLLLSLSTSLAAQSTAAGPRAGAWGAEVSFDASAPEFGGALLRFRNDRSAWLVGLNASVTRRGSDGALFNPDLEGTFVGVGARLGFRSLRSPGSATRPIVGGGILGTLTQFSSTSRQWDAGVYGELGITRFFGQSLSAGVTSDLQLRRTERTFSNQRMIDTRIGFDAVRVAATVIF